MNVCVDSAYKSLNKHHEELCGDKVEIIRTPDSDILILADGMGSGVKANILSTLTSKILATMFSNGATVDECVETVVKTLPICQVRQVAYSTFTILQICHNGDAYLIEYDNPSCIFLRNNKLVKIPFTKRIIEDKEISEYRFQVQKNDTFIIMSDGTIHAGVGDLLNFGWQWDDIADYVVRNAVKAPTAKRMALLVSDACDDLYNHVPGDDTTVAVFKVIDRKVVDIFTGPPLDPSDDFVVMKKFMSGDGVKVVSGGTSAKIAARYLGKQIKTSLDYLDPEVPPIAHIDGIDLTTEGIITLSRTLTLLKDYSNNDSISEEFFDELDKKNGGAMIAKLLIENCTDVNLYVGKCINNAHQNPALPFDISIRMNLIAQMKEVLEKMGKNVNIEYF